MKTKKLNESKLLIIVAFFTFLNLNATNYYVSTIGNDTNNGSIENPWLTLGTSTGKLAPGDTLFVRGGTYIQRLTSSKSGTALKPIVVTNYPNEKPVIDGDSTLASGWGSMVNLTGSYVHVNGFEIKKGLGVGLNLGGSYNVVSNCNIHHHAERGVSISGNYNIFEYCEVWFNAWTNCRLPGWPPTKFPDGGWGTGVSAMRYPRGAILRHNTVHDNWGEGMSSFSAIYTTMEDNILYNNFNVNLYISDTQNTIAQRNLVYYTPEMKPYLRSCIGIAICDETGRVTSVTDNSRSANNKVINNLVYGCTSNFSWWADSRTLDPGMSNILIANNTFVNPTSKSVSINTDRTHTNVLFINNLSLQNNSSAISSFSAKSGFTFSNNLWSKSPAASTASSTDVIGNPLLAQTGSTAAGLLTKDYFKFSSGSPAIDKALVLSEVSNDYFNSIRGDKPDLGAYEFNPLSGINEIKTKSQCFASENRIEIRELKAGEMVSIYNLTGKVVANHKLLNTSFSVPVPCGIYLVKIENKVTKVIVR